MLECQKHTGVARGWGSSTAWGGQTSAHCKRLCCPGGMATLAPQVRLDAQSMHRPCRDAPTSSRATYLHLTQLNQLLGLFQLLFHQLQFLLRLVVFALGKPREGREQL